MTFHNQNKENLLRLPSFSSFSILNHPPTNLWDPPKQPLGSLERKPSASLLPLPRYKCEEKLATKKVPETQENLGLNVIILAIFDSCFMGVNRCWCVFIGVNLLDVKVTVDSFMRILLLCPPVVKTKKMEGSPYAFQPLWPLKWFGDYSMADTGV